MYLKCKKIRFANVDVFGMIIPYQSDTKVIGFYMEKGRQTSLQGQKAKKPNSFCYGGLIYECATPDSIGSGIVMVV